MTCETVKRFPLSYQQKWALQRQLAGPLRRATCWVELCGPLDAERLRESIRTAVRHHEILRVRISADESLQEVEEDSDFVWVHEDLRKAHELLDTARVQQWYEGQEDDCVAEQGPALKTLLATFADDRHLLMVSLPTICADVVSMERLVEFVASRYSGEHQVSDDVFQYSDYAGWQHEIFTSSEAEAGRNFWRRCCRTPQPRNTFPLKFAHYERPRFQSVTAEIDDSVTHQMEAFCSEHQLCWSDLLLACWQAFLHRITQLQHPPISIRCDGRNYPEFENTIGPFSKWLPLRVNIVPDTAFCEFAVSVKEAVTEVAIWQQAFSGSPKDPNDSAEAFPMTDFGFDFTALRKKRDCRPLDFNLVRVECGSEPFVLRLSVQKQDSNFDLEFCFDASRLDWQMVQEWSESYLALLKAAMQEPRCTIGHLAVLSASQHRRVTVEWNQTAAEYPRTSCMHELIEQQVARTPERTAVRCLDRILSYEQLNTQANQVARWLRSRGVGPDQQVGLCMQRSVDMIIGLLGILKAGGAYVPLNPEHPPVRLLQQLRGAVALVTDHESRAAAAGFNHAVLCIDDQQSEWRALPDTNLPVQNTTEDLVYVLFTSGSTGTPKGVAVRHRNLVNYTWFARTLLELESQPEGLQFALVSTICADVGNTCIYPALTSGGCLHVVPYDVATDSARYGVYATRERIDILKIVPSHLEALLSADGGKAVLPRKYLVVGGERLTPELVAMVTAEGVGCKIVNHYAPTETTCGSLTLRLDEFEWESWIGASIPLGRAIANTRLYVLDANRQPLPVGARGELYIGGDGVSAGYLDDPQRTTDRFVPDPFVPGSTLYRSGDIVRYLADGNVEFLERIDDQVKIRGFRVELGEVQAALETHEAVQRAVVLARDDQRGERRMLGWVVAKDGTAISGNKLRDYLKQRLPEYMVPVKIMILLQLPLTRNGKVDRQALPEPEAVTVSLQPRTTMEEMVAAVWNEVLGREQIGMDENFFEIGGHSLLATQIVARLRNRLGQPVAVRTLFDRPTIAELALELTKAQIEELKCAPPPIPRAPRNGSLPLSFAQERLWMLDQFEPRNPLYNVPRAWRLKGPLNKAALGHALNEIVRRHESQRTTFATRNGYPVQVVSAAFHMPLATYDLSALSPDEGESAARRILEDEAARPFDLNRGPLVRACLVQLSPEDHLLLLVSHHIITDAWSATLLFRELALAYEAFSRNQTSPLPEVQLQYGDYAVYERNWLQGDVLEQHLLFWREELAGVPVLLNLPTDRPRSDARSYRGSCETVRISGSIANSVKQLSQAEATTPFAVLISAFHTLLWSYSGQTQIMVGTDVANRTMPELENIVGFFVNLLPIKSDLSQNPTFRQLLRNQRQTLLGAYAHQQLPFAKIVQELQPQRNNRHNPLIQALFVVQNAPRAGRALAGLRVDPFHLPVTSSKFDLAVFIREDHDGFAGHWVYSVDLFDRDTIVQMSRRFELLLENLVANPEIRLDSFFPQDRRCKAKKDYQCFQLESVDHKPEQQASPLPESILAGAKPGTVTEEVLTQIWCQVLEREGIGVDENLFEIGGHSLTATQIASRLRSRLGLEIYVRMIFDYPTIRRLARAIDDSCGELTADAGSEMARVPRVAAKK
jgi:amino acid adenylation domain-containing protein